MGVLRRAVTPAGPITVLFDRLHELHLRAGEPGLRQIARDIGIGVLSHATVHNAFTGPRVPKWGYLELIVETLGGDTALFHTLWLAARQAERTGQAAPAIFSPVPDGAAWACTNILTGHDGEVTGVAFSPNGRLLATVSADMSVRLWSTHDGTPHGEPMNGHRGPVWGVAFSPTGRCLATASVDTTVRLWDPHTATALAVPPLEHDGYVVAVAFSLHGRALVTGGGDTLVRVWDLTDGFSLRSVLTGHTDAINDLAVSPRGWIASSDANGEVRLWHVGDREPVDVHLGRHPSSMACVAFSPDGRTLAAGADDGTVHVWTTATRTCVRQPWTAHDSPVWGLAFLDPDTLITAGRDHTAQFWNWATAVPAGAPLLGHEDALTQVAVDQAGTMLATASDDGTARLWRPGPTRR
ncbi:WD40 repeat domain-containing protein [Amycolatopsis camponoti]|uniref:WD40 repeat domain-containing protein n=1 Tax=Amycolatopsis camponoti TaxID=2606593 RepID=UPI0012D72067|nr:WD40 repeat domain-containing protein [Amycolatopsis camponoti]